jgi:acyl-coenzyme A thioesterase PaaI-like protein
MRKQPNSYDCFVCGVRNAAGVHVDFFEQRSEDGKPEILARFTGQSVHQGYPGRMHGGVISGVLDETIGRAVNFDAEDPVNPPIWGVTVELNVQFHEPVPLDVALTAVGRVSHERERFFEGTGELLLPDGEVAATAVGKYVKLPLDSIAEMDTEALGWRVYD